MPAKAPVSPSGIMASDYRRLWMEATNAKGEAKAVKILAGILVDKEGRNFVSNLSPKDAEFCIEVLDRGIAKHNLKATEKSYFLLMLRRLTAKHERLPESMVMAEKIEVEDEILASGGFSDIRRGKYGNDNHVAVKTLRVAMRDDIQKIRKQFCREVVFWSTLSHPNVLKLVGVQGEMREGRFVAISEWMKNGNIMEYIKENHVNRLELLHGAAQGLEYLHGAGLVHGDLKGANILMSNDDPPRACLADFGFMTMVLDPEHPMTCSTQLDGGTLKFMSSELLAPAEFGLKNSVLTLQSDVYAFGLVIFQVLTGEIPFRNMGPMGHTLLVIKGVHPEKPNDAPSIGFSDKLWAFVERCWNVHMQLRPSAAEVVECLLGAKVDWHGVMPPCSKTVDLATTSENTSAELKICNQIFKGPQNVAPETATDLQTTTPSLLSSPSTLRTELPQQPQAIIPEIKPPAPSGSIEEPYFPHLHQTYKAPPSLLPRKKWSSFTSLKRRFRKFFGLPPRS